MKIYIKSNSVIASNSDWTPDVVFEKLKSYEGEYTTPKTGWTGSVAVVEDSTSSDEGMYCWIIEYNGTNRSSQSKTHVWWDKGCVRIWPDIGHPHICKNLSELIRGLRDEFSGMKRENI